MTSEPRPAMGPCRIPPPERPERRSPERRSGEGGFTLIELLIITVVLGILAAIALVSLLTALEKSKQRATMADMRTVSKAIETYQVDMGYYPASGTSMPVMKQLLVPYQTSALPVQDHWNHDYVYTADNQGNYSLESYGKDGINGADISPATRWQFELDIIVSNGVFTASPEP